MSQEAPRPATPSPPPATRPDASSQGGGSSPTLPAIGGDRPPSTQIPTLAPEAPPHLRTGPPPGDERAPRRLGKFVLLEELGSGGMGTVYKAFQTDLERVVALKALRGSVAAGSSVRERFQREARAVARLTHPGIVRVFEVGETDGVHYFTMEFIQGEDLVTRLRHGTVPLQEAVRWIRDAALAVHHAHENGLIHRDIKPANILVDATGTVKVADFGLAMDATADRRLTLTGEWMGTPHYMSPEQARGDWSQVGPASDVYSLAATLYDVVAGVPPVDATDVYGILERVTRGQLTPLRTRAPQAPRDLETICTKALDLDPKRRYPSAREFAEDLDRLLRLEAIQARPLTWWDRTARSLRRNWRRAAAITVALCLLGTAAGFGYSALRHRLDTASRLEGESVRRSEAMEMYRRAMNPEYVAANGGIEAQLALLAGAVDHCPTFADGHYRLGIVCEETGRVQEAFEHYARAVELDPRSTSARARLAILRLLRGPFTQINPEWDAGVRLLAELERDAPEDPWTGLARAYADVVTADPVFARFDEVAARLTVLSSSLPQARLLLAGMYGFYFHPLRQGEMPIRREKRDLERASREIAAYVGEEPLSIIGRMDRALIRYELGDFLGAESDLEFAMANAPRWEDPPYYLGRVLYSQRRYAEAERMLRRSMEISPRPRHLNFLAIVQVFRRDFSGALISLRHSLRSVPDDTNTRLLYAVTLHCLGQREEADREFDVVAESQSAYAEELKGVEAEMGRPEARWVVEVVRKHLVEFQDILFLAPKEKAVVRTTLVGALAVPRLRHLAEAYQGRTSIRKEVEELVFNLARVEREVPELADAARAAFKKLGLKADPETVSILVQFWFKLAHDLELQQRTALPTLEDCLWRAGTWYRLGQYDKAQADAEEARNRDRTCARAHYAIATLYAIRGKADRCADALHHARLYGWKNLGFVREDPDFEKIRDSEEVRRVLEEE